MSDCDVFSDRQWIAGIGVQDRTVLDVAVFADDNAVVVGTDNDVEPDGSILADGHVADDGGIIGDESGRMDFRYAVAESVNRHIV